MPRADDWHQTYLDAGYIYCRPCDEYHRPPECPIDEAGNPNPTWLDWETEGTDGN